MNQEFLIILYLIIWHLVWDFLLQTSKLVAYKKKSIYGIMLHSLIIWLAQSLLLLPYLTSLKVIVTVTSIAVIHFIIDFSKIKLNIKSKYPIIPFSIDQLAHFSILIWAWVILENSNAVKFQNSWWFESLYQNQILLTYFAGVIFFSYTLDIVYLTLKLQKDPEYKYHRGYFDMLIRVSIFALFYMIYAAYVGN